MAPAPSALAPLPLASPPPPAGARLVALLRTSHFLRTVPPPVIERLAGRASARGLVAGAHLWREGDRATGFHVIVHGLVTVRRTLASGAEVIVAIFGPRENVGDTAALEDARYPADAVVTSDTATVIRLDAQRVLEQSALCPALSLALQQALCRHAAALRTKVEILAAGSVRARLASLFVHLASRFGDELVDGTVAVPVSLARTTLASLVSARTETVIRALRPWERDGVVVTGPGGFILGDLPALTACAAAG
ncbi:MAG: Crp/Fnr family transcriptional regulator [Myxococcales bacterium]|nr:Crp/Fnr family transcriptional regulator [Myxococcales bacterium]